MTQKDKLPIPAATAKGAHVSTGNQERGETVHTGSGIVLVGETSFINNVIKERIARDNNNKEIE